MASQHSQSSANGSVLVAVGLAGLLSMACGRGGVPAQGAGAPPPTTVKIGTLAETSVEDASEFIATLRSLRSTVIQPEVEGIVIAILVKSGQRVSVGTPLVQINADRQQAAVRSAYANRTGTEAYVQYWRQQTKRMEALVAAGAVSRARVAVRVRGPSSFRPAFAMGKFPAQMTVTRARTE